MPELTSKQFEKAAANTGLADDSIDAAYKVLVVGRRKAEVARGQGVSRELVRKWCARILQEHHKIPPGWKKLTVVVPPEDVDKVRAIEDRARRKYNRG